MNLDNFCSPVKAQLKVGTEQAATTHDRCGKGEEHGLEVSCARGETMAKVFSRMSSIQKLHILYLLPKVANSHFFNWSKKLLSITFF